MEPEKRKRRHIKGKAAAVSAVMLAAAGLLAIFAVLRLKPDFRDSEASSASLTEEAFGEGISEGAISEGKASEEEASQGETFEEGTAYEDRRGVVYANGQAYYEKENLETLLILGIDKYEETAGTSGTLNNEQADFILLVVIDHDTNKITPLELNRDTMTEIEILGISGNGTGSFIGQLALAHTYGSGGSDSCINTKKAVSNLLYGVDIDHYLAMTMDAVALVNDAVGGVTVTVPYDMTAADDSFTEGAEITLTGELALKYVRTRWGVADETNLSRQERQRQYMQAFYNTLLEKIREDDGLFMDIYYQAADYLTTDCTIPKLTALFELLSEYGMGDFVSPEGENVLGDDYYEFYVDEDALMELVLEIFYEPVE